MAKILLVEDDNNLREIYEARLQAEGYAIVSARDGEEALVVAKAEQPDLVISDVMMPKISGFEMLDILRNTEGLKDVKVVMLTALGQSEDQTRADSLGADRYLVKSQVTLEDIVNAAHQLLNPTEPANPVPDAATSEPVTATAVPVAETPTAVTEAVPEPAPVVETPVEAPVDTPQPPVIPLTPAPPEEAQVSTTEPQMPPTPASTIPVVDTSASDASVDDTATDTVVADDIVTEPALETTEPAPVVETPVEVPATEAALETEPAAEPAPSPAPVESDVNLDSDTADTLDQEEAIIEQQVSEFVNTQTGTPPPEAPVDTSAEPASEAPAAEAVESAPVVEPVAETVPEVPVEVPAVEPESTAPAASAPSTTPEQEQALADAVTSLSGPAGVAQAAVGDAPAAPSEMKLSGGSNKKVIEPLGTEPDEPNKKSLDQLLAEEEAKTAEPGTTIAPPTAPTQPPANNKGDFDPNSIAL